METPISTTNARDAALASLPPDRREALLRRASDLGVHRADDVIWALVASVVDAAAAAQVAGQHVQTLASETGKIPDLIYQSAAKASADVKAVIETSIAGTVHASVATAAQAGADALRKAAADLPKVAQAEQERIVQEWKSALAQAAREHALAGFLQKLSVNVAVLVILVAGLLVGGAVGGAGGMEYFLNSQHSLVPPGWRLLVDQKGKPLCGPFAGRHVCLVHKVQRP